VPWRGERGTVPKERKKGGKPGQAQAEKNRPCFQEAQGRKKRGKPVHHPREKKGAQLQLGREKQINGGEETTTKKGEEIIKA